MDTKTTSFIFFTTTLLFFTISAARPSVPPPVTNPSALRTATNLHPEPKTTTIDLTNRTNSTKQFHPINRHFRGRPNDQPCHTTELRKDDVAVAPRERTDQPKQESVPTEESTTGKANWMKVKHQHVSSRRHHNSQLQKKKDENVVRTKNVSDREKVKRVSRQQKQKKSDEKNGLMKSIRKFLKHTFD